MRFRVSRLLSVTSLYLLFALTLPGCSGQQQQEEGLEVSEESSDSASSSEDSASESSDSESSNSASESSDSESSDSSESSNSASDSESSDSELSNSSMEDTATADATENDLQEIIQEMNGQQTESTGDAMASDALAQDSTMADPAMQGTDTSMAAGAAPMDPAMAGGAMPMDTAAAAAPSASIPFQPGGTPAGPALPEMGSKMAYIVQSGDTLAKISTKIYATPSRWNELATLSGLTNPSRIYPGDVIYYTLDDSAVAFASAYESVQRSEEMVQPGDTLATIAQRIYGTSTAWKAIWRQNDRIDNPDVVSPGTIVYYISSGALTAAVKQAKAELNKLATVNKSSSKNVTAQLTKQNDADQFSTIEIENGIKLADGHVAYDANADLNLNVNLLDIILA